MKIAQPTACHDMNMNGVDLFGREGLGKLEVLLVTESKAVGDKLQVPTSHWLPPREAKVSRVHQ